MSADNGIYIAKFPRMNGTPGFEYRVIHAQAIENCDYGTPEQQDAYRWSYFGKETAYFDKDEAALEANKMADEEEAEGYFLEYGVCHLDFDRPLVRMTEEEIKRILDF